MKSLKKFLKGLMDKIDQDKIENYFGHGTLKHEHHENIHNDDNGHHTVIKYKCQMKCEGNKEYDDPGNCKICNMKLVPVDDKFQDTKDHDAPHNEEHHNGHKH